MPSLLQSKVPLQSEEITSYLSTLRENSLVENSQFAVSALIEIKLKADLYVYVGGVNVESPEHNRLSLHAEQNASATAQTLLGGDVRFSRIWVMGAPAEIKKGSAHISANKPVMPCGHCRQILLSFSNKDFEVYTVTVNGKINPALKLVDLLPQGFGEDDLALAKQERGPVALSHSRMELLLALLKQVTPLSQEAILNCLSAMLPHIIKAQFKTSPITSCLIRLAQPSCYVPGVLVQDVAFLTTDAIFAAAGQAITLWGGKNLEFKELHVFGASLQGVQLTGSEIQLLSQFAKKDLPIHFYTPEGFHSQSALSSCISEKAKAALLKLAP